MATLPSTIKGPEVVYPTSDGKPMAETDVHRQIMVDLIATLQAYFAANPDVYVSGNLLLFYEQGDKLKHVSPDVFVVIGVPHQKRENYLLWREGKGPDIVFELTSPSTRREDQKIKMALYRDVLKVPEYFLFDPRAEYLKPPLQGHRLTDGGYVPIEPIAGRLPSEVLGLHLERNGDELRLYDPVERHRLLTPSERADAERQRANAAIERADAERQRADAASERADAARLVFEAERERLLGEIERLRQGESDRTSGAGG